MSVALDQKASDKKETLGSQIKRLNQKVIDHQLRFKNELIEYAIKQIKEQLTQKIIERESVGLTDGINVTFDYVNNRASNISLLHELQKFAQSEDLTITEVKTVPDLKAFSNDLKYSITVK